MKRIHIHVSVDDLQEGIAFYERMFGAAPVRVEDDYAKWMIDDPGLNFAISSRHEEKGLRHLGLQLDDAGQLAELRGRMQGEDAFDEGKTTCCYARSEKSWIRDPAGLSWEAFVTTEDIAVFAEPGDEEARAGIAAEAG